MAKLSVSMPVYNASLFLDKSIASILNQTYKNYELILVDDGSTDDSLSVCRKWEASYPSIIRVIEKNNNGSLLTRKRCIEESKGEYIYIMDADDCLTQNNAFEIVMALIEKTEADLIFFENTCDGRKVRNFTFENETIFENNSKSELYDAFLNSTCLYPLWNKVFKKNLINFSEDYKDYDDIVYGTDLYQTIPIISRAKKAVYIKEFLYDYTYKGNANSIVHKFKTQSYITAKKNQMRLEEYARQYNWSVNDLEEKLAKTRMSRIATAIYKGRLIPKRDISRRVDYFKSIGEDEYFRNNFSFCHIKMGKRIILMMIYCRLYFLLACII